VPDLRNSRVPGALAEFAEFAMAPLVHAPLADAGGARRQHAIELAPFGQIRHMDALVLAVPRRAIAEAGWHRLFATLAPSGIFIDVKSAVPRELVPEDVIYWSL